MNVLKIVLVLSLTFGFLAATSVPIDARPPDPGLYSAIRSARKYMNPKSHYAPHEIEECFTDTFNILAQNWYRLPVDSARVSGDLPSTGAAGQPLRFRQSAKEV